MQRSGTEAIRTQIQPSKQKREITKITNSQNTKRTYGQPSKVAYKVLTGVSSPGIWKLILGPLYLRPPGRISNGHNRVAWFVTRNYKYEDRSMTDILGQLNRNSSRRGGGITDAYCYIKRSESSRQNQYLHMTVPKTRRCRNQYFITFHIF